MASVVLCILPHEFRFFAEMLAGDKTFPQTYGSWLQMTYRGEKPTGGRTIVVHPQEFADYCRRHETLPKLAVLQTYGAIKSVDLCSVSVERPNPKGAAIAADLLRLAWWRGPTS